MKHALYILLIIGSGAASFQSCRTSLFPCKPVVHSYAIHDSMRKDPVIDTMILPYRDSISKTMHQYIGEIAHDLPKGKPESLLGNFFCDALLHQSVVYFNRPAHLCIMNYGGIRLPALSAGKITLGKIYELMPFDNFLVMIKIKGHQLQSLLDIIAQDGGWPIAGCSMKMRNHRAFDIYIQGKPLDPEQEYWLITSDYLSQGGDNVSILKGLPTDNAGIFIRDALINFISEQYKAGKKITAQLDGRIRYAE